jgi:hypothetical protein
MEDFHFVTFIARTLNQIKGSNFTNSGMESKTLSDARE